MAQMPTFDDSKWEARAMVSPDGRPFTPSDARHERELIGLGYRFAHQSQPDAPAAANAPQPEVPAAAKKTAAKPSE